MSPTSPNGDSKTQMMELSTGGELYDTAELPASNAGEGGAVFEMDTGSSHRGVRGLHVKNFHNGVRYEGLQASEVSPRNSHEHMHIPIPTIENDTREREDIVSYRISEAISQLEHDELKIPGSTTVSPENSPAMKHSELAPINLNDPHTVSAQSSPGLPPSKLHPLKLNIPNSVSPLHSPRQVSLSTDEPYMTGARQGEGDRASFVSL